MRKTIFFCRNLLGTVKLLLILFPSFLHAQLNSVQKSAPVLINEDMVWIQKVLDNWDVLCRTELLNRVDSLPWIIFYDSSAAWHLNAGKNMLPFPGQALAKVSFAGTEYPLVRVAHSGDIWVPGRPAIPLSSSASATMPYSNNSKTFFIAPLPSQFHRFAPADQSAYLDFLYLGINIHELTHTLQLPYVLPQLLAIEKKGNMQSLDDNTVEKTFSDNERYKELYYSENKHLWNAVFANDRDSCISSMEKAFQLMEVRKQQFFSKEYRELGLADEIFLSLEGSAMWAQYRIMLKNAPDPKPKELLMWLVQQGPSWAQERGLVLFLLIDRFDPEWKPKFFGNRLPAATAYLRQAAFGNAIR